MKLYSFGYTLTYLLVQPLMRAEYVGRENIPEGACVVCANHSSNYDPLLLSYACTKKHPLHYMAKAELFQSGIGASVLHSVGAFPVQRGKADLQAIKTAMQLLKNGEKIAIFPEGTRIHTDDAAAAKSGAVSLAARMRVPILPVYIPREKRYFQKKIIRIGQPYRVDGAQREDFPGLAEELMEKIRQLGLEDKNR